MNKYPKIFKFKVTGNDKMKCDYPNCNRRNRKYGIYFYGKIYHTICFNSLYNDKIDLDSLEEKNFKYKTRTKQDKNTIKKIEREINISKNSVSKNIRNLLWKKYHPTYNSGQCYCGCGRIIGFDTYVIGHVKSKAYGGSDTLDNLRPICAQCNIDMHTTNMFIYIKKNFPNKYNELRDEIKNYV